MNKLEKELKDLKEQFYLYSQAPTDKVGQNGSIWFDYENKKFYVKIDGSWKEMTPDIPTGSGSGDMLKSVYDPDDDGVVDNSEALGGHSTSYFAAASHTHSGSDITSQVSDSDKVDGYDASSFSLTTHNHSGVYAPVSHQHQGSDITSQVSDADTVDGQHASEFASASHDHSGVYAPVSHQHQGTDITSQVSDSDKVDGQHASDFASASHNHSGIYAPISHQHAGTDITSIVDNSDKLDGYHSSDFATATHNHDSDYAPISKGVTNGDNHDHAGGDGAAITENAISLSDVTTDDVSTSKHGFCPKLPDDSSKFLNGIGVWAVPSGGGSGFDPWAIVVLSSDFSTNKTTAQAVTDFNFTPGAGKMYIIYGAFLLRTDNTAYGARPGINFPSGVSGGARVDAPNSAAGAAIRIWGTIGTAGQKANSTGLPDTANQWYSRMEALLITGASPSGKFQITLASENGTVYMDIGSYFMYREV